MTLFILLIPYANIAIALAIKTDIMIMSVLVVVFVVYSKIGGITVLKITKLTAVSAVPNMAISVKNSVLSHI